MKEGNKFDWEPVAVVAMIVGGLAIAVGGSVLLRTSVPPRNTAKLITTVDRAAIYQVTDSLGRSHVVVVPDKSGK